MVALMGCDSDTRGAFQALYGVLDLCEREAWDTGGPGLLLVRDVIAEALDEHQYGGCK